MPDLAPVSHTALSVRDLAASTAWYRDVLGFEVVAGVTGRTWVEKALVHPSGAVVSLQQHDANRGEAFDPVRTGMDHLALLVNDEDDLHAWDRHLRDLQIDHTPPAETAHGTVLTLTDPDRIALEVLWRDGHC